MFERYIGFIAKNGSSVIYFVLSGRRNQVQRKH